MNREIKYRGKRFDNGEWIYGSLLGDDIIVVGPVDVDEEYIYLGEWCSVDPETVGQYTGLKDINQKDIYEGDIIRVPDLYETPESTYTTYHNELVGFERCAFTLGGQPLTDDAEYISDECEVIGNIYENPSLLEVTNE